MHLNTLRVYLQGAAPKRRLDLTNEDLSAPKRARAEPAVCRKSCKHCGIGISGNCHRIEDQCEKHCTAAAIEKWESEMESYKAGTSPASSSSSSAATSSSSATASSSLSEASSGSPSKVLASGVDTGRRKCIFPMCPTHCNPPRTDGKGECHVCLTCCPKPDDPVPLTYDCETVEEDVPGMV
jgi:hypothetical protein